MLRKQVMNLVHHAGRAFAPLLVLRGARLFSKKPHTACLRIALLVAAVVLERSVPMVWAVMPDKALAIVCLASGCTALAGRIA